MSRELNLITGASGHLGLRTVLDALKANYHVRAAVRSQAKADAILAAPSIAALAPGSALSFAIVPDISAPNAFDDAVKDVNAIIHTASPLAVGEDYERDIIEPAIKGTMAILSAAKKTPTVRRVVMTSSIVAVMPWADFFAVEAERVYTADDTTPSPSGPYGHPFEAYAASKVQSLSLTNEFLKREKPHFDVVNVMPGFFIGKNELITEAKDMMSGTNSVAFAMIMGRKNDFASPGTQVHVNDVAKVHVLSLSKDVRGNQNFGIQSGGVDGNAWGDAIGIVKKRFPEAVEDGRLPADGWQASKRVRYDTSETEKVLGIKFQSYEDAVVGLVEQYLELLEKAGVKKVDFVPGYF